MTTTGKVYSAINERNHMNNSVKTLYILLVSMGALFSPCVFSEDGGYTTVSAFQDGKITPPVGRSSSEDARKVIQKFVDDKGYITRWDNKKNRIMTIATAGEAIESFDPDFLQKREALAIEASLRAKAQIIESFSTTASAENILSVPGNPIAKQLEGEQRQLKQMEAAAKKQLLDAQRETMVLLSAYDKTQADELKGVTFGDRLNSLLEASIKKLDQKFDSQKISEDKKQRLSEIKARLERARGITAERKKLSDAVELKISELQGQIKKQSRSSVETMASMPLFGATTLFQVESYDDLKGQYKIASLVIWSAKLEQEARGMMLGAGKGKPRANKFSLDEWLAKQNLASMVGARRYMDRDGTTNFMGISAVEYDPDDGGTHSMLEEEAMLWAKQASILSLKASVESVKAAERLKRDIKGLDGKMESKILSDLSLEISESVKDLTIRGLETIRVEYTVHEPTGKNIMVAVANVNSALAVKAPDIMADLYATLKEVNADQSFIKGEEAGMKAEAAKTENNRAIYNDGVVVGAEAVSSEYDARDDNRAAMRGGRTEEKAKPSVGQPIREGNMGAQSSRQSQSGSWSGDMEVDDDF